MTFGKTIERAALLVLAASIATTTARAQSGEANRDTLTMLPRDFVETMLQPYTAGTATQFFVGKVPPTLQPYLFVPPDARVVGGMATFSGVTAVMNSSRSIADVSAEYEREQPKLGWVPAPTSTAAVRGWGFVPAPQQSSQPGGSRQFCHIGQTLQIFPFPLGNAGTRIVVTVQNFGGACQAQANVTFGGRQPPQAALPVLYNPAGVAMNPMSCTTATLPIDGATSMTERVQTSLTPTELLDLFGKQLADSGWKVGAPTAASVRRSWTVVDSANAVREATLQVIPMTRAGTSTACTEVLLSVRRLPRAR